MSLAALSGVLAWFLSFHYFCTDSCALRGANVARAFIHLSFIDTAEYFPPLCHFHNVVIWLDFFAIFLCLCVLYGRISAAMAQRPQKTVLQGLLLYGSFLILLTVGTGLIAVEAIGIPSLNAFLDKNIQHWDFTVWTYIVLVVGGLGTLGAAVGQLEKSRETLEETQKNNLSERLVNTALLLGKDATEAEKSAGLVQAEYIAMNADMRFSKQALTILKNFVFQEAQPSATGDLKLIDFADNKYRLAVEALQKIEGIGDYLSAKGDKSIIDMGDIIAVSGYWNGSDSLPVLTNLDFSPFKYISRLSYRNCYFDNIDFRNIPEASYQKCRFEACKIYDSMGLGEDIYISSKPIARLHKTITIHPKYINSLIFSIDYLIPLNGSIVINYSLFKMDKGLDKLQYISDRIQFCKECYYDTDLIMDKGSLKWFKDHNIRGYSPSKNLVI